MKLPPAVANTLINDIAVPEILRFITSFHKAAGSFPTEAQVIAGVPLLANKMISKYDAFLAEGTTASTKTT